MNRYMNRYMPLIRPACQWKIRLPGSASLKRCPEEREVSDVRFAFRAGAIARKGTQDVRGSRMEIQIADGITLAAVLGVGFWLHKELASLRERMAKLEGLFAGFTGRTDGKAD